MTQKSSTTLLADVSVGKTVGVAGHDNFFYPTKSVEVPD